MRRHLVPAALKTGTETAADVKRFYESCGCYAYSTQQHHTSRTHATKGLWDLVVLHPMLDGCWWHECKVPGARLTDEQLIFGQRLEVCRVPTVVGGVAEARAFLLAHQVIFA